MPDVPSVRFADRSSRVLETDGPSRFSRLECLQHARVYDSAAFAPCSPVSHGLILPSPYQNGIGTRKDTDAFFYDAEQDVHFCPDGRRLHRIGTEKVKHRNGNVVQSVSYQCDSCEGCSLVSDCRRGTDHKGPRQVRRDEYEDVRRSHRERMSEAETKARYSKRFSIGERPYGSIKSNLGFRRFSVRGQEKVEGEWSLVGTAYNLTRLMSHIGSIGALRQLINNTGN